MSDPTAATPAEKTVSVKLKKPHRHAGRNYPAGATIKLAPTKAEWLEALGVVESQTAAAAPVTPAAPAAKPAAKGHA